MVAFRGCRYIVDYVAWLCEGEKNSVYRERDEVRVYDQGEER